MADDDPRLALLNKVIEGLSIVTNLVMSHHRYVLVLHAYLEAQPGYNPLLWQTLVERVADPAYAQQELEKTQTLLASLLKDFQGPHQ